MGIYRSKPSIVEAVQFTGPGKCIEMIRSLCGTKASWLSSVGPGGTLYIQKVSKLYPVPLNFYIIKDTEGKLTTMGPTYFEKLYESITQPEIGKARTGRLSTEAKPDMQNISHMERP